MTGDGVSMLAFLNFLFKLCEIFDLNMSDMMLKCGVSWYKYVTDAKREREGMPMKYQEYAGSLTDESNMTEKTVELIRESYEMVRAAENEKLRIQRASYVYNGEGVEMDDITAVGAIAPHTGKEREYMDSISAAGIAPPASETENAADSDYEMESI